MNIDFAGFLEGRRPTSSPPLKHAEHPCWPAPPISCPFGVSEDKEEVEEDFADRLVVGPREHFVRIWSRWEVSGKARTLEIGVGCDL